MRLRSGFLPLVLLFTLGAAAVADSGNYVSPTQLDLTALVPPPPAADSPAQQRDLQALLEAQRARTPDGVALAQADDQVSVFRYADVLGSNFNAERVPKTAAFFQRLTRDANPLWAAAKKYWNRPRPYVVSDEVRPVVDKPASSAYPSGHSACGYLWAIVLAQMVPEKRAELFARGLQYGRNRIIAGVHWPTDDEAGRISGAAIAAVMMQSPVFRADLEVVKAELRPALGY